MAGFPNNQGNPAGAIPVYVTSGGGSAVFSSAGSGSYTGSAAHTVLAAKPTRRYLFIQTATAAVDLWVSIGGTAAPNAAGSWKLAAGQTYESGPVCQNAAVSIYPMGACDITVVEG